MSIRSTALIRSIDMVDRAKGRFRGRSIRLEENLISNSNRIVGGDD